MKRLIGTVSRGLRAPIIKSGDNLKEIVVNTVLECEKNNDFTIQDKDILAITESILARSQGNYCSVDDIATDVSNKLKSDTIGVIFPITSRNRFSICLRGFARNKKKIYVQLSYPSDEVGNQLFNSELIYKTNINPYVEVLNESKFISLFGKSSHQFTGVNYVDYYRDIIEAENCEVEFIFANNPRAILDYTKSIINCDIHTRKQTKKLLLDNGAEEVISMDDIMTSSINGSGYNSEYGLLGSNKATEETIKLFPNNSQEFVEEVQEEILNKTGKKIEVLIYGDGAFKDPVGKIWELADPVVSPGYTSGLEGTPNELKLKYLADEQYKDLSGDELKEAIKDSIKKKDNELVGKMVSEGTTPRRLTDLIGSLCDLTSGSGDKGTPFIYISGYFDNYTNEE